ncbi:hypothetical protein KI688_004310 [Linnemannia hyalina]|uniref:Uncharacterized protein n=1 Tax=Linnemannia hyalina TaxID=64524 RepID=A0A9P7XMR3_9FUNG|nr:hypothetical protein KI688_004310 [Linnemannia hyalina]
MAHWVLEKNIMPFGTVLDMTIYIDGFQTVKSSESRLLFVRFVRYMESRGWTVKFVKTEADVAAIAKDATPQDMIISADSDMLGYTTIHALWRPVTGGLILDSDGHSRVIVGRYLSDKRVISKNTTSEDFALSTRVFVDMTQTKTGFQADSQVVYQQLQICFKELCSRHERGKRIRKGGRLAGMPLSGSECQSYLTDIALWNILYTSPRTLALLLSKYPKPATMAQVRSPRNPKTQATLRWRVQKSPSPSPAFVQATKWQHGSYPLPLKAKQLQWKPLKEPGQPTNYPSASIAEARRTPRLRGGCPIARRSS